MGDKCCKCLLPIHEFETGLRHYGDAMAHSERGCIVLLKAEIEQLTRELQGARALNKDSIMSELHDLVGLCSHCGEPSCHGKKSGSYLPEAIHVDNVIAAIDNAIAKHKHPHPSEKEPT